MTRRSRPLAIPAILLAVACAQAADAADADRLRYRRPIGVPALAAEELVAVPLDAPVLETSADGFPDVRVLDAEGREVSRVIRRATVVTKGAVRRTFTVEKPRLEPLPGGGLVIEFSIDPVRHPHPVDGLRLETPLKNFEQRVQVQRLDEGDTWRTVGDDALLYDYSQFMDARQVEIPFPAEPKRPAGGTWRITVDEATIEQQSTLAELVRTLEGSRETERKEKVVVNRQPFRIDAIQAWHVDDVAEIRNADGVERELADVRVVEEPEEKRTRIRVTAGREPVTGLRLLVGDRNFARMARVERPLQRREERRDQARAAVGLGNACVHRVDLRGIKQESLTIGIPETRSAEYEIVIDNADSQPLGVTGVVAIGPAYETVFLAAPGGTYTLAYGGADEGADSFPRPRYDTGAIETALAAGQTPLIALAGAVEEREVTAPTKPLVARVVGNPWFIGGTIAALAVLLGLSLVSAARRIDTSGGPPEGTGPR